MSSSFVQALLPRALRTPRKSLPPQGGRNTLLAVPNPPSPLMTDYFGRSLSDKKCQEHRIHVNAYLRDQLSLLKRPDVRALLASRRADAPQVVVLSTVCRPRPSVKVPVLTRTVTAPPARPRSILKPSGSFARQAAARAARAAKPLPDLELIVAKMETLTIHDGPDPGRPCKVHWADPGSGETLHQFRLITNWIHKVDMVEWECANTGHLRSMESRKDRQADIEAVRVVTATEADPDLAREGGPKAKLSPPPCHGSQSDSGVAPCVSETVDQTDVTVVRENDSQVTLSPSSRHALLRPTPFPPRRSWPVSLWQRYSGRLIVGAAVAVAAFVFWS